MTTELAPRPGSIRRPGTLGARLDAFAGIGPGFDALRIILSVSILCWHSVLASYGPAGEAAVWRTPYSAVLTTLLPMFFALSGFLVMGSATRNPDLKRFISLRGLRILPALTTEVCISAILLGSLLTTLPISKYYTNPLFLKYFGSLYGHVSVVLPGVFGSNPQPNIANVSLWTIAPELLCYVFMAMLLLFRVQTNRLAVTLVVGVMCIVSGVVDLSVGNLVSNGVLNVRLLVVCFGIGNVVFLWRDVLPFGRGWLAICAIFGLLAVRTPVLVYPALACLTYCIAYLGLVFIPLPGLFKSGDYSYGIYLYAFPIQQTVSHILPSARHWWLNILVSLPIVIGAAMASWHVVEKPALKLRARVKPGVATLGPPVFVTALVFACLAVYGAQLLGWTGVVDWRLLGHERIILPVIAFVAFLIGAAATLIRRRMSARDRHGLRPPSPAQVTRAGP